MEPNTRNPQMFSRNASNIVFFPASKHVSELGNARGFTRNPPPLPSSSFSFATAARCTCAGARTCSRHPQPPPPPPPLRPRRLSPPVAPLPQEDKLPVRTTAFRGIHITGKTKVSRSRGFILKLFIVRSPPLVSFAGCLPFCSANLQQGHLSASVPSLIGAKIVNKRFRSCRKGSSPQYGGCVCVYGRAVRFGGSS